MIGLGGVGRFSLSTLALLPSFFFYLIDNCTICFLRGECEEEPTSYSKFEVVGGLGEQRAIRFFQEFYQQENPNGLSISI